ncbi:MAG: type IV pilus modification PilV family protein [Candidatus Muiribacteriota bacterium]
MKKKGFSLIEVVIATAILGTALVFMVNMLTMGTRAHVKVQFSTQAYNLAVEGLEWMKSLDFLGEYWKNRSSEGFFIISAPTYDKETALDGDYHSLMWLFNGEPSEEEGRSRAMLANFVGYYPYHTGHSVDTQEVPVLYDGDFFRREDMAEFKRYGYYEFLDENTVKLTCVVMWEEMGFVAGRNPDRIEQISTVVVNNANIQQ